MVKRENILRMTAEIDTYIKSFKQHELLTKEEEMKCFDMYKNGTPAERDRAVERLIMANQRFVFSLAKKYAKGNSDKILDYVNEGNIGIMNAIEKFEPERGYKFITCAVWYIRQQMTAYSLTTDLFLRKTNNAKIGNNVLKFKKEFWNTYHREPTCDEILEDLDKRGIKIKNKFDVEDLVKSSIDSTLNDDNMTFETNPVYVQNSATENDFETEIDKDYERQMTESLLSNLDDRSRNIIMQIYGIGHEAPVDIEVIAENLNLTPTRVNQIKNGAIKKLKEFAK